MKLNVLLLPLIFAMAACGRQSASPDSRVGTGDTPVTLPASMNFFLTDKPSDNASQVNVNISYGEVFVLKDGKPARVHFAQGLGFVDLLKLQNGALKALGNLSFPPDLVVAQLRFVLGDGNNVVKTDGTVCGLKTPSAAQSGIKLVFDQPLLTASGFSYSFVLDFDVDSSLVFQGNGCLLNPIIRVKSVLQAPLNSQSGTPLTIGGSSDGTWSQNSSNQDPPILTIPELWQ